MLPPPLIFKRNVIDSLSHFTYVKDLDVDIEGLYLNVITRYVTMFYNLHDNIFPQTAYTVNYAPSREVAYQRRRYFTEGSDWIL